MRSKDQYIINLKALPMGVSVWSVELDESFFALHPEGQTLGVLGGKIACELEIDKLENTFDVEAHLCGSMQIVCDRCQTDTETQIDEYYPLVIRLGQAFDDSMDEEIIVPYTDARIDMSQILYEWAVLSLPVVKGHPEGECPEEYQSLLGKYSSSKSEHPDSQETPQVDDRWQALAQLKREE